MKRLLAVFALLTLTPIVCFTQEPSSKADEQSVPRNTNIDFVGFVDLAKELMPEREKRRVPLERFLEMASEPETILLDTRSKWAFDAVHVKGAVHLNFSDFNSEKLRKIIPSKSTRILIYCNNNFVVTSTYETRELPDPLADEGSETNEEGNVLEGTTVKLPPLALNIPTFINLWGYGYKNIFELADVVKIDDPRLTLEGIAISPTGRIKP